MQFLRASRGRVHPHTAPAEAPRRGEAFGVRQPSSPLALWLRREERKDGLLCVDRKAAEGSEPYRQFWPHKGIPTGFRPKARGCAAGATPGNRAESRLNPTGVASSPPPRWHNPVGVGTRNGGRPRVAPVRRNPGLRDAIPSGLCGMRGNLWVRLRGLRRFGCGGARGRFTATRAKAAEACRTAMSCVKGRRAQRAFLFL